MKVGSFIGIISTLNDLHSSHMLPLLEYSSKNPKLYPPFPDAPTSPDHFIESVCFLQLIYSPIMSCLQMVGSRTAKMATMGYLFTSRLPQKLPSIFLEEGDIHPLPSA